MLLTYRFDPVPVLHLVLVDRETRHAKMQASGLVYPNGVRVFGVMKQPGTSLQAALELERALCRMAGESGAKRLYSMCPASLGRHYEQTYPGWRISGTHEDPMAGQLVEVEKHLEEAHER